MPTSSIRHIRRSAAVSAVLGLLLVGAGTVPAQAESTRPQQWFLDAMQAEKMWKISTGEGITVAVIDSGVDANNPDLRGRVLKGKDFALPDRPGDEHTDYSGHGTGMAGLIAGTGAYGGGNGAFGLAPGVKILPVRMPKGYDVNKEVEDKLFTDAIRYSADAGAKVINISMGNFSDTPELTAAVKYALENGSLIFAAAGNSGDKDNFVEYPAATPGVVGVGAVGKDLHRAPWSQHGPQVDISAPGDEMVHACGGKTGLCKTNGTSDATAIASASAALIWSKHPTWTNNQVLRVMLNTIGGPTDGAKRNDSIGYGIVRPRIALTNPGDPGPADKYPLPDLAGTAPKSPSPHASDAKGAGAKPKDDDRAAAAPAPKGDDGTTLWIALGIGAAAVLGAAVTAVVVGRKRRRRNILPPVLTPPAPYMPYSTSTAFPPPASGPGSVRSPHPGERS